MPRTLRRPSRPASCWPGAHAVFAGTGSHPVRPRRCPGPGQAPHDRRRLGPRAARFRRTSAVRLTWHGRHRADPARRTAYDVLRAVDDRDAYANLLLPALLTERGLTGRDAAFATELTYGTLRGRGTYDAILAACSDRDQLDPPVRDVLRLGAHQLLATKVGAHAAVATSVDLAKDVCGPRPSGFVNAVLRRLATRDLDAWIAIVAPDAGRDPTGYLSVRHSYPRWIVEAFREALGAAAAETSDALAAGNARPEVVLALTEPRPPAEAGARCGHLAARARRARRRRGRWHANPLVAVRPAARGRRPDAPDRRRPRGRPGRGQPAGCPRARPGRADGPRRPLARPLRGPGRQGQAAERAGRREGRPPRRLRRPSASRPQGPGRPPPRPPSPHPTQGASRHRPLRPR